MNLRVTQGLKFWYFTGTDSLLWVIFLKFFAICNDRKWSKLCVLWIFKSLTIPSKLNELVFWIIWHKLDAIWLFYARSAILYLGSLSFAKDIWKFYMNRINWGLFFKFKQASNHLWFTSILFLLLVGLFLLD